MDSKYLFRLIKDIKKYNSLENTLGVKIKRWLLRRKLRRYIKTMATEYANQSYEHMIKLLNEIVEANI